MKKLLLSLCIFVFSSVVVLADDNSKEKVASKYRLLTYDIFGGLMYNLSATYDSGAFQPIDEVYARVETTGRMENLSIFAGVDIYAGGYYDKIVKRHREYLISPMIGVQFDYALKNSNKTKMDTFKVNSQFNLLFRLGALFKLKFDTNAKLYFLLGMSGINISAGNNFAIINGIYNEEYDNLVSNGSPIKKHSFIVATLGCGLDLVIKQHFLIGFEYRFTPLSSNKHLAEKVSLYEVYGGESYWWSNADGFSINLHHFAIKVGLSF